MGKRSLTAIDDLGLTEKQTLWVEAYVETGDAVEAARAAGYAVDLARQTAYGNKRKPLIQQAIQKLTLDRIAGEVGIRSTPSRSRHA